MADKIHLEIVTPRGRAFSDDVDEFTAPSVSGEFGVLPAHRPLLAGLKTGIVSYKQGGEEKRIAVGPGFAKVADDRASLITDQFCAQADVDPVVARKELKESQEALEQLTPESDGEEILRQIAASRWAAIRLELYGDPPPPTIVLAQEMRLLSGKNDYTDLAEPEAEPGAADEGSAESA